MLAHQGEEGTGDGGDASWCMLTAAANKQNKEEEVLLPNKSLKKSYILDLRDIDNESVVWWMSK